MTFSRLFHSFIYATAFLGYSLQAQDIDLGALPVPYNQLKELRPYNASGWYSNATEIERLLRVRNVQTVIEVGSWFGASTLHIASLLPEQGIVYAVDTWLGTPDEYSWNTAFSPMTVSIAYDQFLSNVVHAGFTAKISPLKMDSLSAAKVFQSDTPIDLIYIDASHLYENVIQDLHAWYPFVKGHGILCGDDWALGDRGVERAVREFAEQHQLIIHTNGWFWSLEEP